MLGRKSRWLLSHKAKPKKGREGGEALAFSQTNKEKRRRLYNRRSEKRAHISILYRLKSQENEGGRRGEGTASTDSAFRLGEKGGLLLSHLKKRGLSVR